MIHPRLSGQRGHFDHGWLKTFHTFSFGDYRDPKFMGFRTLRVINEDWVDPGQGFDPHPHRDMEIVTYVIEGTLEHKDSLGNGGLIRPGDVQRMSAGTGITHSEYNPSKTESVHLLQIWILPDQKGHTPGYEQKHFPLEERSGDWLLVGSKSGEKNSVSFNQDAKIWVRTLKSGDNAPLILESGRHGWLQVIEGSVQIEASGEAMKLSSGDGASVSDERKVSIQAIESAHLLWFDLP